MLTVLALQLKLAIYIDANGTPARLATFQTFN